MKTLRLLTLAITALLSTLPTLAYDFFLPNADGVFIYYNIIDRTNKTVEVTYEIARDDNYWDISYYSGNIVIPASVKYDGTTYAVTKIGSDAFFRCKALSSVTISNSVTAIGDYAFGVCTGLSSVTIPNSVTTIGESAFYDSGLTSVTIPNSVTEIGIWAFAFCRCLTSVTIPNAVTKIGIGSFYDCSALTSVTLPNSVTEIDWHAFYGCASLTSVAIPNSVTTIQEYAFGDCGLTSVTIGSSVTTIGGYAFKDCWSLSTIYAKPLVPPVCYEGYYGTFDGVDKTTTILYVPQESIEAYRAADTWCEFLNIETDTSSITEVAEDEDTDAPAVYYDLNGICVERPECGKVYIRQKGESTQKIIY